MRLNLAAMVVLGLPVVAAAQSRQAAQPQERRQPAPAPGAVVALPPIGLPLPQIGLPHPPTGIPPAEVPRSHRAGNRPPRAGTSHRSVLPFVPFYGWPYLYEAPVANSTSESPNNSSARPVEPLMGRLQLDVAPGGEPQLYVDGYYVGTLVDFASGIDLEAGPHAVEIRMPGFETLSVAVNVAAGRTVTYRGSLRATDTKAPPAPAVASSSASLVAPAPMIGYIVPGCYIGNVPPQDAGLPASCDISRVITIKR